MSVVAELTATDAKTFKMVLKEPYGLVLESLGKSSSNVPFMMPKRGRRAPIPTRRSPTPPAPAPSSSRRTSGSPARRRSTSRTRNTSRAPSRPRAWPAARWSRSTGSNGSGSPTPQTQVNALLNGEIDLVEAPPHDLLPLLAKEKNIKIAGGATRRAASTTCASTCCTSRSTTPRCARRCPMRSTRRSSSRPTIGDPEYYMDVQVAVSLRLAARDDQGLGGQALESNVAKAKELLAEAGYDGTPVVLMQSTDIVWLSQPRAGRQVAAGEGRLQGRPAADGLADAGGAPHQEGPAGQGRLERLPHLVGRRRRARSGLGRLPQRLVRQGDVRLAVRRRAREAARRLRQGDRPGQAEGDRRGQVQLRALEYPTYVAARPVHDADRDPQQHRRAAWPPALAFWNVEKK